MNLTPQRTGALPLSPTNAARPDTEAIETRSAAGLRNFISVIVVGFVTAAFVLAGASTPAHAASSSMTLDGTVLTVGSGDMPTYNRWGVNRDAVTSIVFEDPENTFLPANSQSLFAMPTLTEIVGLGAVDTSNVTDMSAIFYGASSLASLDVSAWDTSSVTNMYGMFYRVSSVTNLDVSAWDTSNVTQMNTMFFGASSLTGLDVSAWDTSNVTGMNLMFRGASSLTSLDVSAWDTSNVTGMGSMFNGASSLNGLDVSAWDTSNVTNMYALFYMTLSLTGLDVSAWDTSSATDMSSMFYRASALTSLDVSAWDTSNVTNMNAMFERASSLTSLDVSAWETSNVTNMGHMFEWASSLTGLDVSAWDTSNVTNMFTTFRGTSSLTGLDLTGWETSNVTDMFEMFRFSEPSQLTLGAHTQLADNVSLWSPVADEVLTGKWVQVDLSDPAFPVAQGQGMTGGEVPAATRASSFAGGTFVLQQHFAYTFDMGVSGVGDGGLAPAAFTTGEPATLLAASYDRADYTFAGWNTEVDGTGLSYEPGEVRLPSRNGILYAQWTKDGGSGGSGGSGAGGGDGDGDGGTSQSGSSSVLATTGAPSIGDLAGLMALLTAAGTPFVFMSRKAAKAL